jgi:tRNA-splicing ligase RtcB
VFLANTPEMASYRHDLDFAQKYAMANRATMLALYKQIMWAYFPQVKFGFEVNAHHNYVSEEHHFGADVLVTRKGAISARLGEYGIIPGSMGTKSYIVEGLGNPESFHSASHGAGRRMSRSKAKKMFTADDLAAQTAGVECRKDHGVVDEIPAAYKDIEQVMANQADLVSIVAELRQVLCVKG